MKGPMHSEMILDYYSNNGNFTLSSAEMIENGCCRRTGVMLITKVEERPSKLFDCAVAPRYQILRLCLPTSPVNNSAGLFRRRHLE